MARPVSAPIQAAEMLWQLGKLGRCQKVPGFLTLPFFILGHSQLIEAILSDMCSYLYYLFISRNAIMIPIEFHLLGTGCYSAPERRRFSIPQCQEAATRGAWSYRFSCATHQELGHFTTNNMVMQNRGIGRVSWIVLSGVMNAPFL